MEIAYFMNFTSNGDTGKPIAPRRTNLVLNSTGSSSEGAFDERTARG